MSWDEDNETTIFRVVINDEDQYSIWPAHRENPDGWKDVGKNGTKRECLDYIAETWTDMRPRSLRRFMEEQAKLPASRDDAPPEAEQGPSLVDTLCTGSHPVIVSLRPESTSEKFLAAIDRGYVLIKFTDTSGGTELGIEVDKELSNWTVADFKEKQGTVHLEGSLELDYVPVRCAADINLHTMSGTARLEKISAEADA